MREGKLYVALPNTVADQCKKYAQGGLGSPSSLGLVESFGDVSFDPAVLADRLVDLFLDKLNHLLMVMPWEQFGSDPGALPDSGTHESYGEASQNFLKACFGLGSSTRSRTQNRGQAGAGSIPGEGNTQTCTASQVRILGKSTT
jgi:hypothetical protein